MSEVRAPALAGLPALGQEVFREVRRQSPFLALGLAMLALSEGLKVSFGDSSSVPMMVRVAGFLYFLLLTLIGVFPMQFFRVAVFENAPSPTRALFKSVRDFFIDGSRSLRGFITLTAIFIFISSFGALKSSITLVQSFAWDDALDELDRWLHFGYRPWELLAPLLNHPPVTTVIAMNYHMWFLGLTLYWLYFAFEERSGVLRTQALLAFMLTWAVGGVALAMLFSSAGPCYFGKLGLGHDPYAGLMAYLYETEKSWPVWAVGLQDSLWANYASGSGDITKGISAMPSMHNAQCLLLVLAVWNKSRIVRNLAIIHGVLVFVGSVHLGWHYAVDAYLAWIVAGLAWVASGAFARRFEGAQAFSPVVSRL